MNKLFSYILVGGASALAGAAAGYFICKKRMEDLVEDEVASRVNEELSRIRELASKDETNDIVEDTEETDVEVSREDMDQALNLVYQEFGGEINTYRAHVLAKTLCECRSKGLSEEETDAKLRAMIDEFQASDNEDTEDGEEYIDPDEVDEEEPQSVMADYANQPPHVIPYSDYCNLPPYFEVLTFQYFEDDDVLIDDQEEIVDDAEGAVGDALVHFDEEEDGDYVYVVNGQRGNAIEIIRRHQSYAEYCGMGD